MNTLTVETYTKKYLGPVLHAYGKEFIDKINKFNIVGVGIYDYAFNHPNNFSIFVLVSVNKNIDKFIELLNWMNENNYLRNDYPFDHIKTGNHHMLVIKIPEQYYNAYDAFINGKYNKMYTDEQLLKLFSKKDKRLPILRRDFKAVENFLKQVKKEYNVNIETHKWILDDGQADYPMIPEKEIFNYKLHKHLKNEKSKIESKSS